MSNANRKGEPSTRYGKDWHLESKVPQKRKAAVDPPAAKGKKNGKAEAKHQAHVGPCGGSCGGNCSHVDKEIKETEKPAQRARKRATAEESTTNDKAKLMRAEEPGETEESECSDDDGDEALDLAKASVFLMDAEFDRGADKLLRLLEIMIALFLVIEKQGNRAELQPHALSPLGNCECPACEAKPSASSTASADQTKFYSLVRSEARISPGATSIHGLTRSFLRKFGSDPATVRKSLCALVAHSLQQNQQVLVVTYGGSSDVRILVEILQDSGHWDEWRTRIFHFDMLQFIRSEKQLWTSPDLESLVDGDQDHDFLKHALSMSLRMLVDANEGNASGGGRQFHDAQSDVEYLAKLFRKFLDSGRDAKLLAAIRKQSISLFTLEQRIASKKRKLDEGATDNLLHTLEQALGQLGFLVEPLGIPEVTIQQHRNWAEENKLRLPSGHDTPAPPSLQFFGPEDSNGETLAQKANEATKLLELGENWWTWEVYVKWRVTNIFYQALKRSFSADEKLSIRSLVAVPIAPRILEVWAFFEEKKLRQTASSLPPRLLGKIEHHASIDSMWFDKRATDKWGLVFEIRDWKIQDAIVQSVTLVDTGTDEKGPQGPDESIVEILGDRIKSASKFAKSLSDTANTESKNGTTVTCGLLLDKNLHGHVMLPRLYRHGEASSKCCLCDSSSRKRKRKGKQVTRMPKSGIDVVCDFLKNEQWNKFSRLFLSNAPCSQCLRLIRDISARQHRDMVILVSASAFAKMEEFGFCVAAEGLNGAEVPAVKHSIKLGATLHALSPEFFIEHSRGQQVHVAFTLALLSAGFKSIPQRLTLEQRSALLGLLIQEHPSPLRRPDPSHNRKTCLLVQSGDRFSEQTALQLLLNKQYPRSLCRKEKSLSPARLSSTENKAKDHHKQQVEKSAVFSLRLLENGTFHLSHTSKFTKLVISELENCPWRALPAARPRQDKLQPLETNRYALLSLLESSESEEHRQVSNDIENDGKHSVTKDDIELQRSRVQQLQAQHSRKGDLKALVESIKNKSSKKKKKKKKKKQRGGMKTRVSNS